jgi:hypothetical protein
MPRPARRPLALALLAVLVATAAATAFSSASFSSNSAVSGSVTAGTLTLDRAPLDANPIDAAEMRPGQTRTATVTLRSTGSVDGELRIKLDGLADQPAAPALSGVLHLTIEDCGPASSSTCDAPVERYAGTLGALTSAGMGKLEAGEARHIRLTLAWPDAERDTALQGAATTFSLKWELES